MDSSYPNDYQQSYAQDSTNYKLPFAQNLTDYQQQPLVQNSTGYQLPFVQNLTGYQQQPPVQNSQQFYGCDNDQDRQRFIVDTFVTNFADSMRNNPKGWLGRFRKMAANEYAFFRGSAVLFYRDLKDTLSTDPWLKCCKKASTMFIHGDLHAQNFGSYIDRFGSINFDVNDFDEGYLGPFTWDVKRLLVSVNLIAFSKAYCDKKIEQILTCILRSYLERVYEYCRSPNTNHIAITAENTDGPVNLFLKKTRLGSQKERLDSMTHIDNFERKFNRTDTEKDIDDELRHQVLMAFQQYIQTIPESKREPSWSFEVKDIVSRASPGIGSAGSTSYNVLIRGSSETLESDIVIYMKPARQSAVATAITDPDIARYFEHNGLRTVLCAYAMHAVTSKRVGYATLNNNTALFVDEVSPYNKDLEWTDIHQFEDMCKTANYLGKAMGNIHCVADVDAFDEEHHTNLRNNPIPLETIPRHTELLIQEAIQGKNEAFIADMVNFAMTYSNGVRRDHRLFFEAFRNEQIPIVNESQPPST